MAGIVKLLAASGGSITLTAENTTSDFQMIIPAKAGMLISADSVTGAARLPVGTSAQRPTSPIVGQLRFNTSTNFFEVYNGTAWTNSSILSYTMTYLAVSGGGGGSYAGGGAGGLLASSAQVNVGTVYTVTVGAGGAPGTPGTSVGTSGGASSVTALVSTLGGGGAYGASGGAGTAGQGNNGGAAPVEYYSNGAGGGGAGAAGTRPNGGAGTLCTVPGMSGLYFAGGGGSGTGVGGVGGGGNGTSAEGGTAQSGVINSGGGGGALCFTGNSGATGFSGAGGSGICVFAYESKTVLATGGEISYTGGVVIHTFKSSGTFVIN